MKCEKKAVIDLTDCKYIMDLHERIRVSLDFPEGYGKNWDAFWDMLNRDCEYHYVIVKGINTVAKELNDSIEKMQKIMEKNKQYWKDRCPFDYEFID